MFKKTPLSLTFIVVALIVVEIAAQDISFPVDSVKGPMCVVTDSSIHMAVPLSPKHSIYNIVVTDGLAQLTLTQLFVNDYGNIKDIAYVFPLPHEGAVHAMSMQYKDSLYKAEIYEKQEAQQVYDSVVNAGGNAALLLQDRPNVFQQHLANIAFNDSAWVQIKVTMPLSYDNGIYELAIPTMVAERFQSEGASVVPSSGRLWNPPADRDGQTLQINVLLQTGFPIANLQSPTHPLNISQIEAVRSDLESRKVIEESTELDLPYNQGALLQQAATYPNKDFVLRFSRAAADLDFTVASYFDPELSTGYFYTNIFPDTSLFDGARPDLDIVLLIDISGSQNGWPLAKEKEIANQILDKLLPTDRLSVLSFNDQVRWCFSSTEAVSASAENIAAAKGFVGGLSSSGGTNLLSGVQSALTVSQSEGLSRFFVFLTDGHITNEDAILSEISTHPTSPTIFTFGCGNNLNRYFLDDAAKVGNGVSTEITEAEDVSPIVNSVWNKIESPQLKNITVSFTGLDPAQLLLPQGTMLYKGSPVTVYGVYRESGPQTVTITGTRDGETVTLTKDIELADAETGNSMIPQVWARQMIAKLRIDEGTTTDNKNHIIELSKQYQVLSDYTAFLAIQPVVVTEDNSIGQYTDVITPMAIDRLSLVTVQIIQNRLAIETSAGEYIREVVVYDLMGRCLFRKKISDLQCTKFMWDGRLSNGQMIAKGQFVIRIKTTRGRITRCMFWR